MLNRTAARYATVAAILIAVGGVFAWQQMGPSRGAHAEFGPLDAAAKRPEVGSIAPDFVLQEAGTGRAIRLSDYRGKPVVLNFWATWCGPCRQEMPEFQKTYVERKGEVVILALDYRETDALVGAFQEDFKVTFPLLMDRDGEVRAQYGAQGLPATFFIDRDGIVRAQNLGPVVGDLLPEGLRVADQGTRKP